ncbi:hypothetical protein K439DRAFT_1614293 [Ramaria rubella]|nr:hypothetical protein K439DRAFT_1614293 [Ramaria rubella]
MPKPKDSTTTKKSVGRPRKQQKTTAKPAKISDPSKAASVAFLERPKPTPIYNITNSSSSSAQTISTILSNSTTNNDDGDYEEACKAEAALVMMGMARMSGVIEMLSEDAQELGVRNGFVMSEAAVISDYGEEEDSASSDAQADTPEPVKESWRLATTSEPWTIDFLTPLANGTVDTLKLLSDSLWQSARFKIAEKMNVATGSLDIGYKFSTDKVKDPFHALASPVHWLELIEKANIAYIPNSKSKAKKTIPFGVILKDFAADLKGGKDSRKGVKDAKAVKDATGNHRSSSKRKKDSDEGESGSEGGENGALSQGQWVLRLERKMACQSTKHKHCFVESDGSHGQLDKADLSYWAMMVKLGHANTDLVLPPANMPFKNHAPAVESRDLWI